MLILDRSKLSSHFTVLPNKVIRDESLSFRARGLLAYLLSHEDGWKCKISELHRFTREGRDAVLTASQELVKAGYLVHQKVQSEKGTWSTVTYVYDNPQPSPENPEPGDNRNPDDPDSGKPVCRPTSASIRSTKKEVTSKKKTKKKGTEASLPTLFDLDDEVAEPEAVEPEIIYTGQVPEELAGKVAEKLVTSYHDVILAETGIKPSWSVPMGIKWVCQALKGGRTVEDMIYALENSPTPTPNCFEIAWSNRDKGGTKAEKNMKNTQQAVEKMKQLGVDIDAVRKEMGF